MSNFEGLWQALEPFLIGNLVITDQIEVLDAAGLDVIQSLVKGIGLFVAGFRGSLHQHQPTFAFSNLGFGRFHQFPADPLALDIVRSTAIQ